MGKAIGEGRELLRLRGLNHFTLPVRDRYRSARFYVVVLNGEITHESDPDRVKKGLARSLQVGIQVCPGFEIDLFEQDYGQPRPEQAHPHHAFDVRAEDLMSWAEQLSRWRVPHAGPITRAGTKGAELYFDDLDGNHLEIHCSDYPARQELPLGPFDHRLLAFTEPWPPKDLAEEADRLLQESLERMKKRRNKGGQSSPDIDIWR
jgi:catechol 2,3-dioxygenase-like lactoylglutathione lyase family enzyme